MSEMINVLHLEDNQMDAELIRDMLESAGFKCYLRRVDTENEFKKALEEESFDLVISDFTMPGYSGQNALKYVHLNYPEVPFIFVSGTLGEDYAIESLLNGATDYVLKTRMNRLVPAVSRAVAEMEERVKLKEMEKSLKERDARFRALIENSLDGVGLIDDDGNILYRSPANTRILGMTEYSQSGGNIYTGMHPEDIPVVKSKLNEIQKADGAKTEVTFRYKHSDGSWRWLEGTGSNLKSVEAIRGIVFNFRDVTERKESEALLKQAQKMESLGTLAGGIAHDFNNILAIINGYTSFLRRIVRDNEKGTMCLDSIASAAGRATDLVRQLLMFARKQDRLPGYIDVNDIVNELYKLIQETFPKQVRIETALGDAGTVIYGDHSEIHQLILNLCVNGRDAMMDRNDGKRAGGVLKISTAAVSEKAVKEKFPSFEDGECVCISVSDTGVGMDEETRARIFEPFFTTKPEGKGTGLGLSTVYGVVRSHGGQIDVISVPGEGTTFSVFIPMSPKTDLSADDLSEQEARMSGGNEKILVVEDEPGLREYLQSLLTLEGYTVVTAHDGEMAVSLFVSHKDVRLVLSDIGLPKIGGIDLMEAVKMIRPETPVILASGFLEESERRVMEEKGVKAFIQKPYDRNDLLRKIREALNDI